MDKLFKKGNEIIAEAAIRAGLQFFSGYPITPQTELLEYMSQELVDRGGVFVQAESELSAITMVQAASSAGARAMTATSGPGLSLMAETLNSIAMSRLPAVIVDVQRAASTIAPEQSDYNYVVKGLGHNGQRGLVCAPGNLQECADLTFWAFEKADQYSVPVFIMVDGMIGQMEESVLMPDAVTTRRTLAYTPPTGCAGRPAVQGKTQPRPVSGQTSEDALESGRIENYNMYRKWVDTEALYEEYMMSDAEYVFIAYGSAARICRDAVRLLRNKGIKAGLFRPITLHPFPEKQIAAIQAKGVLTVEMALPPMLYDDVRLYINRSIPHTFYSRCGGNMVDEHEAAKEMLKLIKE